MFNQIHKKIVFQLMSIFFFLFIFTNVAMCDVVTKMQVSFKGYNIYAPSILLNSYREIDFYSLWYSGWQKQSNYDTIYYRASLNGSNWSDPYKIISPMDIGPNYIHVGDPNVTKHFNKTNQTWQYTMFYTACMEPCNQEDNEIWSAVSNNGLKWVHHQMLLAGPPGPAEPSAIIDPSYDGTFWKVYYVDRLDPIKVKMARVDADRHAFAVSVVYQPANILGALANPEVRKLNNTWNLFFNFYIGDPLDHVLICKSGSASNEQWNNDYDIVIDNNHSDISSTTTPGILPINDNEYLLFFGLVHLSDDYSCNLAKHSSIHQWTFSMD